jgi:hypothetical protein
MFLFPPPPPPQKTHTHTQGPPPLHTPCKHTSKSAYTTCHTHTHAPIRRSTPPMISRAPLSTHLRASRTLCARASTRTGAACVALCCAVLCCAVLCCCVVWCAVCVVCRWQALEMRATSGAVPRAPRVTVSHFSVDLTLTRVTNAGRRSTTGSWSCRPSTGLAGCPRCTFGTTAGALELCVVVCLSRCVLRGVGCLFVLRLHMHRDGMHVCGWVPVRLCA